MKGLPTTQHKALCEEVKLLWSFLAQFAQGFGELIDFLLRRADLKGGGLSALSMPPSPVSSQFILTPCE